MRKFLLLLPLLFSVLAVTKAQVKPSLGTTANFTVLAGTEIVNRDSTVIYGNIGVWPNSVITGFPPGVVNGSQHAGNTTAQNTQADLAVAYSQVAAQVPTNNLSGQNLGGRTILPGVHRFDNNADLTGALTFDAAGDPNAVFIIQILGDFTTSANAVMNLRQGARALNIFWQIGGSATVGAGTALKGTYLVNQSITLNQGAALQGRLFAQNGFVHLNRNPLTIPLPTFISDLSVTKTASVGPYYKGQTVTFTIIVKNLGPSDETNVLVSDLLPPGLAYVSSRTTRSTSYNPSTGLWTIDLFRNNAIDTLTIVANITTTDFLTNTATIAGDGIDNIKGNNAASATICAAPEKPGEINGPVSLCLGVTGQVYSIPPVTGARSYVWSVPSGWNITSGQGTTSITVDPGTDTLSATLFVTAVNACDESLPSTLTVYATNLPPAAPAAISGNPNVCIGQSGITYTIPAVWGASSYTWAVPTGWTITSGQGTTSITVTAGSSPGAISVTATNGCGTGSAATLLVTPVGTAPLTPGPILGDSIPCSGASSVTFSVPAVLDADTYNWSVPAGWSILTGHGTRTITVRPGATGGTVSVSAANACGVSGLATIPVAPASVRPSMPGTISGVATVCSSQTVTYTISSVTGASGYTWTVPGGWTITSGQGTTSITVTAGASGGTVSVASVNGCGTSVASTFPVTTIAAPAMPAPILGDSIPCSPSIANTYSIPAVPGATSYTWTTPAGWVITSGQGSTSINVTVGSSAGVIRVVAVNSCGASQPRTLTVSPTNVVPSVPIRINGTQSVCSAQTSVTYSVAPVTGASSYAWTVPAGWVITSGQGTATVTVTVGSTAGVVSVTAANGCGAGGAASLPVTPSTTPPGRPGVITGDNFPCDGSTGNTYTISPVIGASSYTWSVPTGWVITAGQGTTTITVLAGSATGSVSVTAGNACGTSSASVMTVTPSAAAPLSPGSISGNSVPCIGNTNNIYSIAPVAGASSYTWVVPSGWVITSGQGTTSITVTAGTGTGVIAVRASNGCGNSAQTLLAVTPASMPPAQPGAIMGDSLPCVGSTGTAYSISPVPGASTYNWTVPSGWTIASGQGTTSITVTAGAGTGTISVTASNSCGTGAASILIGNPVAAAPAKPAAIVGDTAICGGQTLTYTIAPVANASGYTWVVPAGWNIDTGQGSTSITVTAGNGGGTVSVLARNGCGNSTSATLPVAVKALPDIPAMIMGDSVPCVNNSNTVYHILPAANADTYTWTVPAGWSILSGQGTTSITVNPGTNAGTVAVVAENSCGASAASALAVAPSTVVPISPVSIIGDSIPCTGSTNTVYTVAPVVSTSGYTWTVPTGWTIVSGQGTNSIIVTVGANGGTITASATNGCGTSSAATLNVKPGVTLPAVIGPISGDSLTCSGQTGLNFSIAPVPGASSYNWTVPAGWTITAGQGTNAIVVTAGSSAGSVGVTASNGCGTQTIRSQAVNITTLAPAAPGPITGDPVPCQGMQTATYSINPVTTASTYTWTVPADWQILSGQGTTTITASVGTIPGTIAVTASNTCGTSLATSFSVRSSAVSPVKPGPISGNTVACVNDTAAIYHIVPLPAASGYVWSVPAGWQILAGAGTAQIQVKVGTTAGVIKVHAFNGCGVGDTSTLTVVPATSVPVFLGTIKGADNVCEGQTNLTYTIDPEPDAGSYNWVVPNGWTIVSGQGTSTITVTAGTTAGDIKVTATNGCGSGAESILPTSINPPVALIGEIHNNSSACEGLSFEIDPVSGADTYTWTVPQGWTILSGQGTTAIKVKATNKEAGTITVTAGNGNCASLPATLLADPAEGEPDLQIMNAFSPNGDGVNDTWEIRNLQNYQDNELVVLNRWGNEVYRTKNYENTWEGSNLSAGTYFYVLKVKACDGKEQDYKGYVMIVR